MKPQCGTLRDRFVRQHFSRRQFILTAISCAPAVFGSCSSVKPTFRVEVFRDESCNCCGKWADYLKRSGFTVVVTNASMPDVRKRLTIPESLASCHTATVDSFVVEGHVPASDIRRLLKERPRGTRGLAVPGMPASAPGMDQLPFRPFEVLAFDQAGGVRAFSHHTTDNG